ncbi:MAG: apolipoprotein N-acyltransferase [Rickettsiaceae bacterium]|nr:apolipoprotein N-acyltransferase [Rickettsiaceae bacterium]
MIKLVDFLANNIERSPKLSSFILGLVLVLSFAPLFFIPALISIGIVALLIKNSGSFKEAFFRGYIFGFGFFLGSLHWTSIAVSVYIEEFWWAIPFALLGIPLFLAQFFGFFAMCGYFFSASPNYINIFSSLWIIFEFLRSYLYSGFPWNLIGYSFAFSDVVIQTASFIGVYGIGYIVVFSFASFYYCFAKSYSSFITNIVISLVIWSVIIAKGLERLSINPTNYTNVKIRIVQPSIPQTNKWSHGLFWSNLEKIRDLSLLDISDFKPDIVIWPESAVIEPPTNFYVYNFLESFIISANTILITGGVYHQDHPHENKRFASIYAINKEGSISFDYHKSHLVPFGEYIPFAKYIPLKQLAPGIIPYSPGSPKAIVELKELSLKIKPIICYEAIFPSEVLTNNQNADVIINVTNDAWYGNSSGPYQHFYMTRLRAVESGLPLLRVGNNGISGIIDPVGRIIAKTDLDDVINLDGLLPKKIINSTFYSIWGDYIIHGYFALVTFFALISLIYINKANKN